VSKWGEKKEQGGAGFEARSCFYGTVYQWKIPVPNTLAVSWLGSDRVAVMQEKNVCARIVVRVIYLMRANTQPILPIFLQYFPHLTLPELNRRKPYKKVSREKCLFYFALQFYRRPALKRAASWCAVSDIFVRSWPKWECRDKFRCIWQHWVLCAELLRFWS